MSPSRYLNPGPPEYEADVLLIGPRRSHITIAGEKSVCGRVWNCCLSRSANLLGVPPTPGGDCCTTAGDITLFVDNLIQQRAGLSGDESAGLPLHAVLM